MTKVSMFQAADLLAISRRALSVVFLGSAITLLASNSALAEYNRGQRHGNQHGDHGQRGWHGDRQGNRYPPGYRYPYAQPVYVPPPVYYEPRQSPGISLFFPLDLRR
jgi:hypothetical protein